MQIPETWRDIHGFEGCYQVSNSGKIKSLFRFCSTSRGRRQVPGKILSPKKNSSGYLQVDLCFEGQISTQLVHQLVARHYQFNCQNSTEVNHLDGDKTNNWYWNLQWTTRAYNMLHATETGLRDTKGVNHHLSQKVIDTETKQIFDTITAAAISVGFSKENLWYHLTGKRKKKKTTLQLLDSYNLENTKTNLL